MEKKNMQELNLEEMDKVSGGMHDTEENRRYVILKAATARIAESISALIEN